MATADALVTWARRQIGTVEMPPGSNRIKYWDQIGMSGAQGQPWCAAFVLAGLERIGVGPVSRSVYVPTIRNDYQRAKRLRPIEEARPGDQVFFSFGNHADKTHTGIVESIDFKARTVTSIDGNTAKTATGSDINGGGVWRRTRIWGVTWGVGRPAFDPVPSPLPPVVTFPEDQIMRVAIQLPATVGGSGYWVLDGNAGDGTPGGPARPAIKFTQWTGAAPGVNGRYHQAPDKGVTVTVCESDGGFCEVGFSGFPAGSAPLVFLQVGS